MQLLPRVLFMAHDNQRKQNPQLPPPPEELGRLDLQDRDRAMFAAIHEYDGVLADYQLRSLFYQKDTTGRYFLERMSKLIKHEYVGKPERKKRSQLEYTVFWLGTKGAELLAGQAGL